MSLLAESMSLCRVSILLEGIQSTVTYFLRLTSSKFRFVQVVWQKEKWVVYRTWTDFRDLHVKLEKQYGGDKLPTLPPAKFFGAMDPAFVRKRGVDLEVYTEQLLRIESVRTSDLLHYFLSHNKVCDYHVRALDPLT